MLLVVGSMADRVVVDVRVATTSDDDHRRTCPATGAVTGLASCRFTSQMCVLETDRAVEGKDTKERGRGE